MPKVPKQSFCLMPQEQDALLRAQQRLAVRGIVRNQSEVIRCAIGQLDRLDDEALEAAVAATPRKKPGRRPA